VETSSASVVSAYERRIAKLEKDKLLLNETLQTNAAPRRSFDEQFELAFEFLANPWKSWFLTDWKTRNWC
jgi:site-specific DNA recombinase